MAFYIRIYSWKNSRFVFGRREFYTDMSTCLWKFIHFVIIFPVYKSCTHKMLQNPPRITVPLCRESLVKASNVERVSLSYRLHDKTILLVFSGVPGAHCRYVLNLSHDRAWQDNESGHDLITPYPSTGATHASGGYCDSRYLRYTAVAATENQSWRLVSENELSNFTAHAHCNLFLSRWHHQMETFSALLVLCAGNSPVSGEFPAQRPMTRSFDVFFDLRLNKRLSKQCWGWWFETPSRALWRQSNVIKWCNITRYWIQHENDRRSPCTIFWNSKQNTIHLPHAICTRFFLCFFSVLGF